MSKNSHSTCCFCCHVKIGTFILVSIFLAEGVFGIVGASFYLAHNDTVQSFESPRVFKHVYSSIEDYSRTALWIMVGNGVFYILVAFFAMFALVKNSAGFLVPYLIVVTFNFACTVLFIGSTMYNWNEVKYELKHFNNMPEDCQEWLKNLDDRWLAAIVFSILFICLFIKSYFLSIGYKCYKHIKAQNTSTTQRDPEVELSHFTETNDDKVSTVKLPKYEDIQKFPLVKDAEYMDTKPPPYSA